MASVPLTAPTTGTSVYNQLTDHAKIWQEVIDRHEENSDFYQSFEGGEGSYIVTKTDTSKGKGQELVIRMESGFYDEPHYGDDLFEDDTHFEDNLYGDYSLLIDVIRHGSAATERSEEYNGLRGEIRSRIPQKLGNWLGRFKTENLDMMFREQVNAENIMRPNGHTKDTIVSADGLSWNFVSTASSALARLGGQKGVAGTYENGKSKGKKAYRYVLVASKDACTVLKQDPAYQTLLGTAGQRGVMNPYFTGEVQDLDGITVVERDIIDHDGVGPIGSPLNPRARLGTAITAANTTFDITGGGNATNGAITKKKYFKYFKNHAYKFAQGTTLSQDANTHYVMIINPPTHATAPNKWGFYSYTTGNNGNKITIVNRLRAAANTAAVTTLGGVTWDSTVNTDVHDSNALIIQTNAKGEPLGYSILMAHAAAFRGYGKFRNKRGSELHEDGFVEQVFMRSYFGQKLREDRLGRHTGCMLLEHALKYM